MNLDCPSFRRFVADYCCCKNYCISIKSLVLKVGPFYLMGCLDPYFSTVHGEHGSRIPGDPQKGLCWLVSAQRLLGTMAMDGITRKQPHGDLFMAEFTYTCQRRCTKRVLLGGKEQPGVRNTAP